MTEIVDASSGSPGDPNAPEKIAGRSDSDRATEIERKRPAAGGAAASDPAAKGTMGGQSAGADYEHPAIGGTDPAGVPGGQSNPGYSGPGQLAGTSVNNAAHVNAVRRGDHYRKAP